ncbi:MAG TPA: hypothetical protein VGX48_06850 [Pyrinomonadaceae bacterium]|jgi:biopolymer transport protein ExbD|nr:hypothetical protein [Pyrinomonadaceae bacterium]
MKHSHAPLLLLASLLAPACAPDKPADFREAVKDATKNVNLHELAMKSERTIAVKVDEERRVFFRKEQVGTADEAGPLKVRVRQAIERNRQAARDSGDEEFAEHAATVFVCAPLSFKYGDVAKVIDVIKEAGGGPVGITQGDCSLY